MPFYFVQLGGPKLLLTVQAVVVALGAWPLYLITLHRFCGPQPAPRLPCAPAPLLIFPLAYLLLPTLQAAVLFDFHAVTLAPTFLLFAFLALERGRNRRFWIFAVLAMACKEDMPLVVAMIGLYAGLAHKRWALAGATLAVSAAWFMVAVFVIQPLAGSEGNIQLNRYAWLGATLPDILQTLLTQPGLVLDHLWQQANLPGYLLALFLPVAFLALLSPLTLLLMLPTLAVNLLSDNPFTWRLEDFHYGAPLAPFLMISAAYGTANLTRRLTRAAGKRNENLEIRIFNRTTRRSSLISNFLILILLLLHSHLPLPPRLQPTGQTVPVAGTHRPPASGSMILLATYSVLAHRFLRSRTWPPISASAPLFLPILPILPIPIFRRRCRWNTSRLMSPRSKITAGCTSFYNKPCSRGENYNTLAAEDGILIVQAASPPTAAYRAPPPPFYTFARPAAPVAHRPASRFWRPGAAARLRAPF